MNAAAQSAPANQPEASQGSSRARILTPILAGLAVAFVCMTGYFELAEDFAISPKIAAFDAHFGAFIQSWRTPALTWLFRAATLSADPLTAAALVFVGAAILIWLGRRREAILGALIVVGGAALGTLAKQATARPRPPATHAIIELPPSFAFPSGHTLSALLLWTMIAFAVLRISRRRWPRVLAVVIGAVMAVLVGTSRVYLGVHWPSDVLASWLLGVAWLSVVIGGFRSWERWRESRAR